LNEKPEFEGLNPSIERFAHIFCRALAERLQAPTLTAITVILWEHENAWASYRQDV
ncbi:MAG: 6-carboxytetrahydropterin synthase, partial [Desulfurellaceae bacterium]|nr:6-carboxytetrahydropterin synthase [Desulfurellaceae bacterium]